MTLQELAAEYCRHFEQRTRDDGSTRYWVLAEGRPEELQELVYQAHGDMMPDDWKYEFAYQALDALSETEYPDEVALEPDIYTGQLLSWLASNLNRAAYVDQAVEDYGWPSDGGIVSAIGIGQLQEKEEVLCSIRSGLEKLLEEMDEDEGEEE